MQRYRIGAARTGPTAERFRSGVVRRHTLDMKRPPPTVAELFERQYAVASDTQLAAAGVTASRLQRHLDDGDSQRPCPGVVRLVGAPPDWRQTPMAVTLGRRRSVVGVGAAVRVHGLDGFADHEPVDAFVERGARRSLPDGVTAHSSRRLKAADITMVGGIRVTSIATTLVHCAAVYPPDQVQQALDDALRRGKKPRWFIQTIERWQGKGVSGPNELRSMVRSTVGERIPRSWYQRLAHRALDELGVRLEHEVPVFDGTERLAELDLADVDLMCGLECQSWEWHSTPAAVQHDLERKRRLRALGWEIVEMWWSDLERMDVVFADLQVGMARQRRLSATKT
jgi:hypothetical protein